MKGMGFPHNTMKWTWFPHNLAIHCSCQYYSKSYSITEKNRQVLRELQILGDTSVDKADYGSILHASSQFMLCCYGLRECADLNEARVRSWERKMSRNVLEPPKMRSLPPTEVAFYENVLRAHLAAALMKGSINPDPPALSPTKHGWYTLPTYILL